MLKTELVSVITPSYNTANFIGLTIESVLAQTYENWEMIIVDDASTDNSKEIIQKYADKDVRIIPVFLKENKGQGNARNVATKRAKGRFIAFLDSDDIWINEKLEKQIDFMIKKNYPFTFTSHGFIDENNNKILKKFLVEKKKYSYRDLLKHNNIGCLTAIYDAETINKQYMINIRKKQDYELWLRILKMGYKAVPLEEVLAYYRQRKNSTTSNKKKLIKLHYEFLRNIEKLSVLHSLYYTFSWGWNGLKKYYK